MQVLLLYQMNSLSFMLQEPDSCRITCFEAYRYKVNYIVNLLGTLKSTQLLH